MFAFLHAFCSPGYSKKSANKNLIVSRSLEVKTANSPGYLISLPGREVGHGQDCSYDAYDL